MWPGRPSSLQVEDGMLPTGSLIVYLGFFEIFEDTNRGILLPLCFCFTIIPGVDEASFQHSLIHDIGAIFQSVSNHGTKQTPHTLATAFRRKLVCAAKSEQPPEAHNTSISILSGTTSPSKVHRNVAALLKTSFR